MNIGESTSFTYRYIPQSLSTARSLVPAPVPRNHNFIGDWEIVYTHMYMCGMSSNGQQTKEGGANTHYYHTYAVICVFGDNLLFISIQKGYRLFRSDYFENCGCVVWLLKSSELLSSPVIAKEAILPQLGDNLKGMECKACLGDRSLWGRCDIVGS